MRNKKELLVYIVIVTFFNLITASVFAETETLSLHGRIVKIDKHNHTMIIRVSDEVEKIMVFDEKIMKSIEKQEIVERDFVFIKYKVDNEKNVISRIKKVVGCGVQLIFWG